MYFPIISIVFVKTISKDAKRGNYAIHQCWKCGLQCSQAKIQLILLIFIFFTENHYCKCSVCSGVSEWCDDLPLSPLISRTLDFPAKLTFYFYFIKFLSMQTCKCENYDRLFFNKMNVGKDFGFNV